MPGPSSSRRKRRRKLDRQARPTPDRPTWGERATEAGLLALVVLVSLLVYVGTRDPGAVKRLALVVILPVLGLLWLLRLALGERLSWPRSPMHLPLVLFLLVAGLSTLLCAHKHLALEALGRLVVLSLLYFLVITTFRRPAQFQRLFRTLCPVLVIICALGILQRLGFDLVTLYLKRIRDVPWQWSDAPTVRVFSTLNNPTYFASFLVVLLPLFFSLALSPGRAASAGQQRTGRKGEPAPRPASRSRLLLHGKFAAVAALMFACLFLTATRAAWAAAFGAFALYGVLLARVAGWRRVLSWKVGLAGLVVLAGLFGLFYFLVPPGQKARAISIFRSPGRSEVMYLQFWSAAWELSKDHPLLGVGLGNYNVAGLALVSPSWYAQEKQGRALVLNRAHNTYLGLLSELGWPGLLIFLWLIAGYFWTALKAVSRTPTLRRRYLLAGLTAGAAGFLLHNLFGITFHIEGAATFFWLALGLTVALSGIPASVEAGVSGPGRRRRELQIGPRSLAGRTAAWLALLAGLAVCVGFVTLELRHFRAEMLIQDSDSLRYKLQSGRELAPGERQALWERAVQELERANKLNPNSIYARYHLGFFYGEMGLAYRSQGNLERARYYHQLARDHYRRAVQLNPYVPDFHRNLGVAYEMVADSESSARTRSRLLEAAAREYREMVRLGQKGRGNYELARLFAREAHRLGPAARAGKLEAALVHARRAVAARPDLLQYHLQVIGILEEKQASPAELRQALKAAIECPVESPVPYLKLGQLESRLGNWEQAVSSFRQAIMRDPRSLDLRLDLGKAYLKLKRWPEASRALLRATELPGPPAKLAEANFYLAWAWKEVGDREKARAALVRARELDAGFQPAEVEKLMAELSAGP
jgi:O-antigen ligase/Flp pilus assembly protein TadD